MNFKIRVILICLLFTFSLIFSQNLFARSLIFKKNLERLVSSAPVSDIVKTNVLTGLDRSMFSLVAAHEIHLNPGLEITPSLLNLTSSQISLGYRKVKAVNLIIENPLKEIADWIASTLQMPEWIDTYDTYSIKLYTLIHAMYYHFMHVYGFYPDGNGGLSFWGNMSTAQIVKPTDKDLAILVGINSTNMDILSIMTGLTESEVLKEEDRALIIDYVDRITDTFRHSSGRMRKPYDEQHIAIMIFVILGSMESQIVNSWQYLMNTEKPNEETARIIMTTLRKWLKLFLLFTKNPWNDKIPDNYARINTDTMGYLNDKITHSLKTTPGAPGKNRKF